MFHKLPKKLLQKLIFLLLFLFFLLLFSFYHNKNRAFSKFIQSIVKEEYSKDTLSLHYSLVNTEGYFKESFTPSLPCFEECSPEENEAYLKNLQFLLEKYEQPANHKRDFLTAENRLLYKLFSSYLSLELEGLAFSAYGEPFSPSNGIQSQLPILLAEYTFRSREDIDDYLALLEEIPAYLESLMDFEELKYKEGLFMSDTSIDKLLVQCDMVMDNIQLEKGEHFLQKTFAARLSSELLDKPLSSEEKADYLSCNDRLLTTLIAPAYEKLGDFMLIHKGQYPKVQGLCRFPQGKEYYLYLLHRNIGSDRSYEEYKTMLLDALEADTKCLLVLLQQDTDHTYPNLMTASSLNDASLPYQYLTNLLEAIASDFPLPKDLPEYTVKSVDDSLMPYTSPAFYMTPPVDDYSSNIIYINYAKTTDVLSLYTTLAHEGFPGHLYQNVYYRSKHENLTNLLFRNLLSYGGYTEGWAYYVEMLSYDYINGVQDTSIQTEKLLSRIQLNLLTLLDLLIHYEGYSPEDVCVVLGRFGITSTESCEDIYEYICEAPGVYPTYYLGYLELLSLKELAKDKWRESYTDKAFHSYILYFGPSDFSTLREYISRQKPR